MRILLSVLLKEWGGFHITSDKPIYVAVLVATYTVEFLIITGNLIQDGFGHHYKQKGSYKNVH
jgi:hypothetical protein